MLTFEADRSVLTAARLRKSALMVAAGAALVLAVAAFWLQPQSESPAVVMQAARLSHAMPTSGQPTGQSLRGFELEHLVGPKDKYEVQALVLPPGSCHLVHDAEGNTEGHCDLNEVNPTVSNARQSPFGVGQWAPPEVQRQQ